MNNFIIFFNDNEGFFSVLLSFFTIIVSLLIYYNQKKMQIDLQQRQFKLDLFKEKFECYHALRNLVMIAYRTTKSIEDYSNKNISQEKLLTCIKFAKNDMLSIQEIMNNIFKLYCYFPKDEEKINTVLTNFYNISNTYIMLEQLSSLNKIDEFDTLIQNLYGLYKSLGDVVYFYKELEKVLNLDGIEDINSTKITTSN